MKYLDEVITLINNSNNILFFTGAGISTNCGIPDFRSQNGLYSYAEERYKVPYPEAVFDLDFFKKNPEPFYKLTKDLISKKIKPSTTHNLISNLEEQDKLLLVATQNIDMLHEKAGNKKVLSCHGSYLKGTCRSCGKLYRLVDYKEDLLKGVIPYCKCSGIIKPNITFFGEPLPQQFYDFLSNPPTVDLVITMGTSLEVQPANQIPLQYCGKVPTVIINIGKTKYDSYFDYTLSMDCDDFSKEVINKLNSNYNL